MVQINFALKEVNCKIVYYGPGMSGKTTNLEVVHRKAPTANKGELTSIATEGDRTLFFDFMPLDLGNIAGMRTKFQLYTVPGQVYYNSTRKLVLQGVDGIIFVADSQEGKMEENLESLENLRNNLAEYGKNLDEIPMVIQYNKRDLPNALSAEAMADKVNPRKLPSFEAVATTGEGVFPTLKALSAMVLESLSKEKRGSAVPPRRRPAPATANAAVPGAEAVPAPSAAGASAAAPERRRTMAEEAFGGGAPRPEPGTQGPANGSRPPPAKRPAAAASGGANAGVAPPRAGGRIEKGFDTFLQSQKVHEPSVSPVGAPISVPNTPDERSPTPGPHRDEDSRRPERRRSQTTSFEPKDRAPRPHQPQPQSQSQLVQKFVLKDERKGSSAVLVLLGLIVAVAVGVILYSFKVI